MGAARRKPPFPMVEERGKCGVISLEGTGSEKGKEPMRWLAPTELGADSGQPVRMQYVALTRQMVPIMGVPDVRYRIFCAIASTCLFGSGSAGLGLPFVLNLAWFRRRRPALSRRLHATKSQTGVCALIEERLTWPVRAVPSGGGYSPPPTAIGTMLSRFAAQMSLCAFTE